MVEPCEAIQAAFPTAVLTLVVDDLSIQIIEEDAATAELNIVASADLALQQLQRIGGMVSIGASWCPGGKTVVAASHSSPTLTRGLKARGIAILGSVRHLGVDYAPSAIHRRTTAVPRYHGVRKDRMAACKLRSNRVQRLRAGLYLSLINVTAHHVYYGFSTQLQRLLRWRCKDNLRRPKEV